MLQHLSRKWSCSSGRNSRPFNYYNFNNNSYSAFNTEVMSSPIDYMTISSWTEQVAYDTAFGYDSAQRLSKFKKDDVAYMAVHA